jgi:hydrogenase expression/formation protein HypC
MCIGIPMQVVEPGEHHAVCDGRDGRRVIDLALVGPQPAGAWLLTFVGAAREMLDAESAQRIDRALDTLANVLAGEAGDIEAGFADLIGREPQLPVHLEPLKD